MSKPTWPGGERVAEDAWQVAKKYVRKEAKSKFAAELCAIFEQYGADCSDTEIYDAARSGRAGK